MGTALGNLLQPCAYLHITQAINLPVLYAFRLAFGQATAIAFDVDTVAAGVGEIEASSL